MFEVNDYVVFGSTGVCQITDIIHESFGTQADREYYVLNPVYANSSTIYIPIDNKKVVLRRVLTRPEIDELIQTMPDIESEWISEDAHRKAVFNEALQSGDLSRVVRMIKIIYSRRGELEQAGKKLSNADSEAIKAAERLLHDEFALVLDIQPEQVGPFILGEVQI